MTDATRDPRSIGIPAARRIATTTKGAPTVLGLTPRWFCRMLPWVGVSAGTYRVNKARVVVPGDPSAGVPATRTGSETPALQSTFVDYELQPREHSLSALQRIVRVDLRVKEMFCAPMDQLAQQLRVSLIELKERKEWELFNNASFGLLPSVVPGMRVSTRSGPPTPDDLDELLARVWKQPALFVAHPRAIAAFGRECTRRGVPPATVQLFGSPFITWRGVPLIPSDKIPIVDERTSIVLVRLGEAEQGVVGVRDARMHNEHGNSVSVHCMGVTDDGLASYLVSLYFALAVLADDAVGVLEGVELGHYEGGRKT